MSKLKSIQWFDLLFVALAMSVGWGWRGNYGHEPGAMIPGALGAIAVCLASGRPDWWRRIGWFGLLGAVGWAFGGQMSYGYVIGYTRSADLVSVAYGFGGLFLIGMIWGAIGGGLTALAATLDRKRLMEMIFPFLMVIAIWGVQDIVMIFTWGEEEPSMFYYYDSNWMAAVTSVIALLFVVSIQRKITHATSLMLHMALGWIAGMLVFVTLLDLHLSPPRSDNWAGAVGLMLGLILFLIRRKHWTVLYASLYVAIFSGIGFAVGQLIAVLGASTGVAIDWWKVMEQTFGLFAGLGMGLVFLRIRHMLPEIRDEKVEFDWGQAFAIFFMLVPMFWINLRQNVDEFLKLGVVQTNLFGMTPYFWFHFAYILFGMVVIIFILNARRMKLDMLPESAVGKGQWLFLFILWWAILGDQFQALIKFNQPRLIVEGSFYLSALLLTAWVASRQIPRLSSIENQFDNMRLRAIKSAIGLLIVWIFTIAANTSIVRYFVPEPMRGSHKRFERVVDLKSGKEIQADYRSSFLRKHHFPSVVH